MRKLPIVLQPATLLFLLTVAGLLATVAYFTADHFNLYTDTTPEWLKKAKVVEKPLQPVNNLPVQFSQPPLPATTSYEIHSALIYDLISVQRYREAETMFSKIADETIKTRNGHPYFTEVIKLITDVRYARYANSNRVLENWVNNEPDNPLARLLRGVNYYFLAWQARGRGWASTVSERKWKQYRHYLDKAGEDITLVHRSGLFRPQTLEFLLAITTSYGARDGTNELLHWEALQYDASYFPFHKQQFRTLQPFWYGGWRSLFEYSWQAAATSELGHTLMPGALKLYAIHHADNPEKFLNRDDVWPVIVNSYQTVFNHYPNNTRWLAEFAEIAILANRLPLARQLIERAIAIYSHDLHVLQSAAHYYLKTKQWEKAMNVYNQLTSIIPKDSYILAKAGWTHLWGGRYSKSASYYTKAIELAPGDPQNWLGLCHVYYLQQYYESAYNECSEAINLDKKLSIAYYLRALASDGLGMSVRAAADRQVHDTLAQLR